MESKRFFLRINPLYRDHVLEAPTSLEKSAGLTFVHWAWIELVRIVELNREMTISLKRGATVECLREIIDRVMAVSGAKERFCKSLMQVTAFQERRASRKLPASEHETGDEREGRPLPRGS